MAPIYSKFLTKNNALVGVGALGAVCLLLAKRQRKSLKIERKKNKKDVEEDIQYTITEKTDNKEKVQVDRKLFSQLAQLLKIVVPGWGSSEAGMFLLIAASLVARSICDLWMINHATMIESAIVSMDKTIFKQRLFKFLLSLPLIALVNNTLKYAIGDLKIRLRTNLTKRLYDDYLTNYTYYRLTNLDNRIANPDQLLTTDVDKFCEAVTDLYCNTAKPLLDMGIYVYKLSSTMGGSTPGIMLGYLMVSGALLTNLRKPTAKLTSVEQKLEGEFRHINSRLITHSEEVAFYNGNQREKTTLLTSYRKLQNHLKQFLKFRVIIGVIDNLVAKYFASIIGFIAVSLPFLGGKIAQDSQGERSRLYYTYGRMLVKLAEAIGRLVLAGRDLTRLAGFTNRVTQLRHVISELNNGKYERTMLQCDLIPNSGKVVFQNNIIQFNQVPLVTPNGDVLIKELTFEIKSGMNVLVCGPNGAGKSSLFRILGELWPLFGGQITKPPRGKLFYIPQRPYMTLGSLRDQLTYPHSTSEAKRRGATDVLLTQHLTRVNLNYLLEREGGLDAIADWLDVLSGGEKQRIAMARLFYHKPQFAILDECTSAVSVDVEGSMYKYCKEVGITLLTVSHRKSLWQHHEYVMHLDGRGGCEFRKIEEGENEFGS